MKKRICNFVLVFPLLLVISDAGAQETEPAGDQTNEQPLTVKQLMQAAYDKTKGAETVEDYTAVIDLCEQGLAKNPNFTTRNYLAKLSAWAYNRRGKQFSTHASEAENEKHAHGRKCEQCW